MWPTTSWTLGHVLVEVFNFHPGGFYVYLMLFLVEGSSQSLLKATLTASLKGKLFFTSTSMMCAKVCCTDNACKYNATFDVHLIN